MLVDLVLTVPGAHESHGAQTGNMNPLYWRPGQRSAVSIGGSRPNGNYFLLDGTTDTDPTFNTLNLSPWPAPGGDLIDRERAVDRLEWSTEMADKGYVSEAQKIADKLSLARPSSPSSRPRPSWTSSEVHQGEDDQGAQRRGREGHSRTSWPRRRPRAGEGQGREAREADQAVHPAAPGDGLVVYANDPGRFGGASSRRSRKGRASASGRRSSACRTSPRCGSTPRSTSRWSTGSTAASGPGSASTPSPPRSCNGLVQSVSPLPDANTFFGSDIKVYTTQVAIENGPSGLRPGMSAKVEILVSRARPTS